MSITEKTWITRKCEDDDCILIGYKDNDGAFVILAKVTWYGEDDCNAEQDEAIANLIAAAPELYRACKEVLATFVGFVEGSVGGQTISQVKEIHHKLGQFAYCL